VTPAAALAKVRKLCLSFPGATERASHGAPAFFVDGKRQFLAFANNHHGDGRLAVWCAAPEDAQAMLVATDPEVFFVPPYVGPSGWVGVRLDRDAPWGSVAQVIEQAYLCKVKPKARRAAGTDRHDAPSDVRAGARGGPAGRRAPRARRK
jgi:hypothetical protein